MLVWRAASQQGLPGANGLLVVGLYAAAAIGLGLGAQTFLMVTSAIASLAAWDLMELSRTLEQVGSDFPSDFVKAHTGALGIVLISSAGLALLAVALDGQLPFAAIFGLALLLAASLFFSMKVLETTS